MAEFVDENAPVELEIATTEQILEDAVPSAEPDEMAWQTEGQVLIEEGLEAVVPEEDGPQARTADDLARQHGLYTVIVDPVPVFDWRDQGFRTSGAWIHRLPDKKIGTFICRLGDALIPGGYCLVPAHPMLVDFGQLYFEEVERADDFVLLRRK